MAAPSVAVAIAAGCGGTAKHAAATPAHGPAAAWHQVVLCARHHGLPNLPEPTIDATGQAHFPSNISKIPAQTRQACQALYDRLVPTAVRSGPTQAQLDSLLQFARCMRSHGVADWPDPRPDGSFPLDSRLAHQLKSAIRTPMMACDRFNPDPKGRLYASHP